MNMLTDHGLRTPTLHPGKPAGHIRRAVDHLFELTAHISAALRASVQHRRARRAVRAQRRMLAELDERTLKDIGLHRTELDSLSAELEGLAEPSRRQRANDAVAPLY